MSGVCQQGCVVLAVFYIYLYNANAFSQHVFYCTPRHLWLSTGTQIINEITLLFQTFLRVDSLCLDKHKHRREEAGRHSTQLGKCLERWRERGLGRWGGEGGILGGERVEYWEILRGRRLGCRYWGTGKQSQPIPFDILVPFPPPPALTNSLYSLSSPHRTQHYPAHPDIPTWRHLSWQFGKFLHSFNFSTLERVSPSPLRPVTSVCVLPCVEF